MSDEPLAEPEDEDPAAGELADAAPGELDDEQALAASPTAARIAATARLRRLPR
jgi:hypothetical protein